MLHPAPPPPVSSELQAWLDRQRSLLEMKIDFEKDGSHMSLPSAPFDPELLPEPVRSEAIEHLQPTEEELIERQERIHKAILSKLGNR